MEHTEESRKPSYNPSDVEISINGHSIEGFSEEEDIEFIGKPRKWYKVLGVDWDVLSCRYISQIQVFTDEGHSATFGLAEGSKNLEIILSAPPTVRSPFKLNGVKIDG